MAKSTSYKEKLKSKLALWKKARESKLKDYSFPDIPSGKYFAEITKAEVIQSDKFIGFKIHYTIDRGDYEDTIVTSLDTLFNSSYTDERLEQALTFFFNRLQKLEYDTEKLTLDDLDDVEKDIVGLKVSIGVKNGKTKDGKDVQNVRVNKILSKDDDEEDSSEDDEEETEEEDNNEEGSSDDDEEEDSETEEENEEDEEEKEEQPKKRGRPRTKPVDEKLVGQMSRQEIRALIKAKRLKINPDRYASLNDLREKVEDLLNS